MGRNWQFSLMAPFYDHFIWHRSPDILKELLQLKPGLDLLDVGGGTGQFVNELTGRDVDRYVVVDMNQSMMVQGHDRPVLFVRGDATELPFKDRTFDRCLFLDSLHHIGSLTNLMPGIRQTMKDDGLIVLEEFDPRPLTGRAVTWLETVLGMGSTFWPPERLVEIVEQFGFRLEDVRESGFVYYASFRAD